MEDSPSNRLLLDRAEISDVVHRYARAIDLLDWNLFRSCFTDRVDIDFTSMNSGSHEAIPVEAWMEQVNAGMSGFDATHHLSANHTHQIEGDRASCVSYLVAEHFIFEPDGSDRCLTLGGYYTNQLTRTADGWKIFASTLTVTWHRGQLELFEESRQRYLRGQAVPSRRGNSWTRARQADAP